MPGLSSMKPVLLAATITAFLVLNTTLNMLNRWVLGVYHFKFPIFLTMSHLAIGFCILAPVMALPTFRPLHQPTIKKQGRGIAAVGFFKVMNIVLNNASLVHITLSLNQIIRSAIPVITAGIGVFVEQKVPTAPELSSLLLLTLGVVLSVWEGSITGSMTGISIALSSTLSGAAMLSFSGKILSEKLDVLRLTFYTAPVSVGVLVPFFLWQEAGPLWQHFQQSGYSVLLLVVVGAINAVAYNITHYQVIFATSSIMTPVIGMIKVIGVIVLSAIFLGEDKIFSVRMVIGCALALAGFCSYSLLQSRKQAHQTDKSSLRTSEDARPMQQRQPAV